MEPTASPCCSSVRRRAGRTSQTSLQTVILLLTIPTNPVALRCLSCRFLQQQAKMACFGWWWCAAALAWRWARNRLLGSRRHNDGNGRKLRRSSVPSGSATPAVQNDDFAAFSGRTICDDTRWAALSDHEAPYFRNWRVVDDRSELEGGTQTARALE